MNSPIVASKKVSPVKVVAVVIFIVIISFVLFILIGPGSNSAQRRKIASAYNKVVIPDKFQFKQRLAVGDGVDSMPGYEYDYNSAEDQIAALNDMKTALEQQGFSGGFASTPGVLIEHNPSLSLKLDVEFQQPGNLSVIARLDDE
jgi:hypothetical protein